MAKSCSQEKVERESKLRASTVSTVVVLVTELVTVLRLARIHTHVATASKWTRYRL